MNKTSSARSSDVLFTHIQGKGNLTLMSMDKSLQCKTKKKKVHALYKEGDVILLTVINREGAELLKTSANVRPIGLPRFGWDTVHFLPSSWHSVLNLV